MSAKIISINFSWDHNYVSFSDTDISTDYFHGYLLNQKETAEWIKEDGAETITVTISNNDSKIPAERRLKKICKIAGYEYENKSHTHTYWGGSQGWKLEYELRRLKEPSQPIKVETVKVPQFRVKWFMPYSQQWTETVSMDWHTKNKFIRELVLNNIEKYEVMEA
jgi:hypothetical protein